jgi:murein DD-endopeptidase MepM/ murein hydrolase activator NlpD
VRISFPTNGNIISPFGVARDGGARSHEGVDISATKGQAIYAAAAGRVFKAGWISSTAGLGVEIDHGGGFVTKYFHCQQVFVGVGQQVAQGAQIASADNTGNAANTVTHLHFELWSNGRAVDPVPYFGNFDLPDPMTGAFLNLPAQVGGLFEGVTLNGPMVLAAVLFVIFVVRRY